MPNHPELPPAPPLPQINQLVEAAARAHGHLCPGQVIGVRMAILGLGLLGYACPPANLEIKNLVALVEIERCLADAIATATGLRPGRGSLKLMNLGLLAATFLDLPSGRAVRLVSRDQARDLALTHAPQAANPHAAQLQAYRVMPNHELFDIHWVRVNLQPHELPGARLAKVPCVRCGILVRDGQTHGKPEAPLCAVCAGKAYFSFLNPGETS